MSDTFSQALSAVTEALSNPPPPESIDMETVVQLLGAMEKLRVMLEPPNLAVIKFCTAVREDSCASQVPIRSLKHDSSSSRMHSVPYELPKVWGSSMHSLRQMGSKR